MMTAREKREIARMTAEMVIERMHEEQDRMMPLTKVCEEYGWSKSFVYKNADRLGGVKTGGRLFFSRKNLEALIRNGMS